MSDALRVGGGNQHADNPDSSAAGLFQLMGFWYRDTYGMDPYDPVANIQMARWVWDQQGYAAWNPYKRGLCTERRLFPAQDTCSADLTSGTSKQPDSQGVQANPQHIGAEMCGQAKWLGNSAAIGWPP